jgi:FKBP-type peptidyl-prolyl cis-trans isomerase FkpA
VFKDRTTLTVTVVAVIALVIMVLASLLSTGQPPIVAPSTVTAAAGQSVAVALATQAAGSGFQTTASGLKYEVVTEGTGAKPTASSTVTVNYRGVLPDGTQFDSSYDRGQPATFSVGGVIAGWTEGLQLMAVGSKYIFVIPPELGYGAAGQGPIPPNSTLIFEVELLSIQ